MGLIYPRQTSFVGGEIAPALWGRTDIDTFHHSLKRSRNFFPNQHGALLSRPGTKYLAEAKDSSKAVKLIPFDYSNDQTFVIEAGEGYFRFYTNGGQVLATGSPAYAGGTTYAKDEYVTSVGITYRSLQAANIGHTPASSPTWWAVQTIYEISSPYVAADLDRLKHAQAGDVIDLTRQGYQPRQLKRLSNIHWTLSVAPDVFKDAGGHTLAANGVGALSVTGVDTAGDATHPPRTWYWIVSVIRSDGRECWDYPALYDGTPTAVAMYTDRAASKAVISWPSAIVGAKGYRIYRGLLEPGGAGVLNGVWIGGLFTATASAVERGPAGLVGTVGASATSFTDIGTAPDYGQQAPLFTDPYPTANDYPAVATYLKQRRILAGSVNDPGRLHASKVADYGNFDGYVPPLASDALDITLASLKREEIRSLLAGRDLFAFTSAAVWAVSGAAGAPLSPTSIEADPHVIGGASWLSPIGIDSAAIYTQDMGGIPRDLAYSREAGGYVGKDLAMLARHLFAGHTIVDWTFAREPYSVVWAVRDDGVLLALTFVRDQGVCAWSWHDTDGAFENVCAVAENGEHAVYVVVRRTVLGATKRYVERFATRQISNLADAVFVDCAISFNGSAPVAWSLSVNDPGIGQECFVASPQPDFANAALGDEIVFLASTDAPIRVRITGTDPNDPTCELITPAPSTGYSLTTTDAALAVFRFTGLGHLEGKTVSVLADGDAGGSFPVVGGAIVLPVAAAKVTAGLAYVPEMQLLDLALQGSEVRAQQKLVRKVAFEVTETRGLAAGPDFDHLTVWKQRQVSDSYQTVQAATALVEVNINSTWGKGGGAVLRQTVPLPITVASAIREVELGSS